MKYSLWVSVLVVLCCSATIFAEGTIEVTAQGTGETAITSIELRFLVKGVDDLSTDALKSFNASRRRGTKAIEALEIEGLKVSGEGLEVTSEVPGQDPWGGVVINQGGGGPKKKVKVQEVIVIAVPMTGVAESGKLLDRLSEVIDTALDVGLEASGGVHPNMMYYIQQNPSLAPPAFMTVVVEDEKKLRHAAYESAMKKAREKAGQLAELSGGKVSGVKSIKVERIDKAKGSKKNMTVASSAVTLRIVFNTEA